MNDSVVSIRVQGGIGNMMFQTAFVLAYSMVKNCKYEILNYELNLQFNKYAKNRMNSDSYRSNIFSRLDFSPKLSLESVVHPETPFTFVDVPFENNKKNIYLGYFQSEKYFFDFSDQIKSYYLPSESMVKEAKNIDFDFNNSVALHIRRSDFVYLSANHPPVDINYVNNAVEYFGKNKNYLIVSDDIQWCKENISLPNSFYSENRPDHLDLYSMTLCENNIISNSTFSWWAAWLNSNKNKIVIRPANWFGQNYAHLIDKDLIPHGWIAK